MFFFSLRLGFLAFGMRPLLPLLALDPDRLLGALAGAGVGVGPLAVHRQAAPVPEALVADDLDLALDVLVLLAAQVALDLEVGVDVAAQPHDLVLGQIADPGVRADHRTLGHFLGPGGADPVDIGEPGLEALFPGQVDAGDPCHLALPLLVAWVRADHHDPPVPADDLALLAHPLDARLHFHRLVLICTCLRLNLAAGATPLLLLRAYRYR